MENDKPQFDNIAAGPKGKRIVDWRLALMIVVAAIQCVVIVIGLIRPPSIELLKLTLDANGLSNRYVYIGNLPELESMLKTANEMDSSKFLQIIDRERETGMSIITVLGILLSVAVVFVVVNRLVDREELDKTNRKAKRLLRSSEAKLQALEGQNATLNAKVEIEIQKVTEYLALLRLNVLKKDVEDTRLTFLDDDGVEPQTMPEYVACVLDVEGSFGMMKTVSLEKLEDFYDVVASLIIGLRERMLKSKMITSSQKASDELAHEFFRKSSEIIGKPHTEKLIECIKDDPWYKDNTPSLRAVFSLKL